MNNYRSNLGGLYSNISINHDSGGGGGAYDDEDPELQSLESKLKSSERELESTLDMLKELDSNTMSLPASLLAPSPKNYATTRDHNYQQQQQQQARNFKQNYNSHELSPKYYVPPPAVQHESLLGQSSMALPPYNNNNSSSSNNNHNNQQRLSQAGAVPDHPDLSALIQSIQEQIRITQQLAIQTEQENASISQQLSRLARGGLGSSSGTTKPLSPLVSHRDIMVEDEELRQMRLQHEKELEKLRFEHEKMLQETELEQLKKEKEKQLLEEQEKRGKEQQVESRRSRMRIKKEKAGTNGFLAFNQSSYTESDLMKQGFQVYFDYVTGVPSNITAVSLIYGIYDSETAAPKTPVRRTPVSETDVEMDDNEKHSIFLVRRQYPRELLSISRPLKMIIELLSVNDNQTRGDSSTVESIGWTQILITNDQGFLSEGCFILPLYTPHVNTSLQPGQLDQFHRRLPSLIFIRVVSPANFLTMETFPVSLSGRGKYNIPGYFSGMRSPNQQRTANRTYTTIPQATQHKSNLYPAVNKQENDPMVKLCVSTENGNDKDVNIDKNVNEITNTPTISYDSNYGIYLKVEQCSQLDMTSDTKFHIKIDLINDSNPSLSWTTTDASYNNDTLSVHWHQSTLWSKLEYQKDAKLLFTLFKTDNNNQNSIVDSNRVLLYWKVLPLFKLKIEQNEIVANTGKFNLKMDEPPIDIENIGSRAIDNYDKLPSLDILISNSPNIDSEEPHGASNNTREEGFVVCIDKADMLPENVLLTRILVQYYTTDYTTLGTFDTFYMELNSCCLSPEYKYSRDFVCVNKEINESDVLVDVRSTEFEAHNLLNHDHLHMVVQIETVDPIMRRRSLGYSVFTICNNDTESERNVRYGGFRLPVHVVPFPTIEELKDGKFKEAPRLPCASIFIRVCPMTRNEDGVLLRRSLLPANEWEAMYEVKQDTNYEVIDGAADEPPIQPRTAKETVQSSMQWKTGRHVLDNLQIQTNKKGTTYLYDTELTEISHLSSEVLEKRMNQIFQAQTISHSSVFVTPFIDELGFMIIPECVYIEEKYYDPSVMYFLVVKVFLVLGGEAPQSETPEHVHVACCAEVDWEESRSGVIVWKRQPIFVSDILKDSPSHLVKDIIVEMSIQYYPNTQEKLKEIFPYDSKMDITKEFDISPHLLDTGQRSSKSTRGLRKIIKKISTLRNQDTLSALTLEGLQTFFDGQPTSFFSKYLHQPKFASKQLFRKSELQTLCWSFFSVLISGRELGCDSSFFTKSGQFVSPFIHGSVPKEIYRALLVERHSIRSTVSKYGDDSMAGAVFFQCFDSSREQEFDWLVHRNLGRNYAERLTNHIPVNYAGLAYYTEQVGMSPSNTYGEFVCESIVDACADDQVTGEKLKFLYSMRDQLLNTCYESLRATIL